jgi:hypothetical protein
MGILAHYGIICFCVYFSELMSAASALVHSAETIVRKLRLLGVFARMGAACTECQRAC